ncbi:hypothetical protein [Aquimonas sp.]|jgi:hypothetical protein|uniref:hypothetical protein n=1 Tax=Aquimonas sp. TaxID=1872588 RepID=UPI0037C0122D
MELVVGSNHDHAWFDLGARGLTALKPPAETFGQTMAQMLTSHPVWPGPQGELYTLPQHDLAWRPRYLQMSRLQARCGAGEFDANELQRLMAADPGLNRIRMWGAPDPCYLSYLAELDRMGGIEIEGPRTTEEHNAREALATRCIVDAGLVLT